MSSVIVVLRLFIAFVFLLASYGKLIDRQGTRDTIVAFGLPYRIARPSAMLLPIGEILAAIALLPTASARWGGTLALLLLLVFMAGIARALSQGLTPDCNCFGQLTSEQIGPRTLARNTVLAIMCALVVWKAPGSSLSNWTGDAPAANLVASLAVTVAAVLGALAISFQRSASTLRTQTAVATPTPGLIPGTAAPEFSLEDLGGGEVTLASLLSGGLPVLLVFASPTCGPCRALIPEIGRWSAAMSDKIAFAVVESGVDDREQFGASSAVPTGLLTLVEPAPDVAGRFMVTVTPTAVAIAPDGSILAPAATGAGAVEALVRSTLSQPQQPLAPVT